MKKAETFSNLDPNITSDEKDYLNEEIFNEYCEREKDKKFN